MGNCIIRKPQIFIGMNAKNHTGKGERSFWGFHKLEKCIQAVKINDISYIDYGKLRSRCSNRAVNACTVTLV